MMNILKAKPYYLIEYLSVGGPVSIIFPISLINTITNFPSTGSFPV